MTTTPTQNEQPTAEGKLAQPGSPPSSESANANDDKKAAAPVAEKTEVIINVKQMLGGGVSTAEPVRDCFEDLPKLHGSLHIFNDPRHDQFVRELDQQRILVLTSFEERAAYAAAFSLAWDDRFAVRERKTLFPTRGRARQRADLDLLTVTEKNNLGDERQILLIEIDDKGPFLDSARGLGWGVVASIRQKLLDHGSYVILTIDEALFGETSGLRVACHSVSHTRYLLEKHVSDHARADELEGRLLACIANATLEKLDIYHRVASHLESGIEAFERFLHELEQAGSLSPAERKSKFQTVSAPDLVREDSEVHRAVAFVAAYFEGISERDFNRLVLTLLGDQKAISERTRETITRDGAVISVREELTERWAERWTSFGDRIFHDCRLRVVESSNSTLIVDFTEPYLRRELRAYFARNHPWYVRKQCQTLQDCGMLFHPNLSPAAVDALIRLFVDRAVADPAGFGTLWMTDLVRALKIQLGGEPPTSSPAATMEWVLEKLLLEKRLHALFLERIALLIRELLELPSLRSTVHEFFELLIASRQGDALLDVVLELARRLRFAPNFDPLVWMRRLLDQGSAAVRGRTAEQLVTLARRSGPRIYELLASIRTWLPETGREAVRFSVSNRVALEFPFAYCLAVAASLPEDAPGQWPSQHPLFYALPELETPEAQKEIAALVEWVLDPRGAALETADPANPLFTAEAVRVGFIADLIEHWAWILIGPGDGTPAGRALLDALLGEVTHRIGPREASWLQRSWQRRYDEYVAEATGLAGAERTARLRRRNKLDHLRKRFTELAAAPPRSTTGSTTLGGAAS